MYKIRTKLVLYCLDYFLPVRMPDIGVNKYQYIYLILDWNRILLNTVRKEIIEQILKKQKFVLFYRQGTIGLIAYSYL